MNIPRLRRGRKRRRSDPTGGEDRSVTSEVSWADQFNNEELQLQQQQLRRASTNTMPDLWRYQQQQLQSSNGGGLVMPDNTELASSAYLNSLIRRESLPVSFRSNPTTTTTPTMQPPMRTASPSSSASVYSTYPSLADLRRSMTPSTSHTWHGTPSLVSYVVLSLARSYQIHHRSLTNQPP